VKIFNYRVRFDRVLDYIPIVSAINNLIDAIQKRVFSRIPAENASPYQFYIKEKRAKRCLIYSIPFGKLIYRILLKGKNHGKNESIHPFYKTEMRVLHAYRLRNESKLSQHEYDKVVKANFSKILKIELPEIWSNDAFEMCTTFMGSSTKPYALVAHAIFFGWNENKDFVRIASLQFSKQHCRDCRSKKFEKKVRDFKEFYDILTPQMQALALAQFKDTQLEVLEPLLSA
jgi:hypothetical protein